MTEENTLTRLEQAQIAAWDAILKMQESLRESRREMQESRREMQESRREMQESRRESQKSLRESRQESQKFLRESRQEMQESRRESQKSLRESQELRESIREMRISITKQTEAIIKQATKQAEDSKAFSKRLEESNKRTGRFDRKFGELWELMVIPNIKEKFNELGFRFDSVARDLEFDRPNGRTLTEVDILLENGKYAIVVEVKDSFKKKYLEEHLDRMKKLKTLPRFANKKLYGAIAAGFAKGESKQLAFENGFYVVHRPDSMNVQIEQFPKGCKPRAW